MAGSVFEDRTWLGRVLDPRGVPCGAAFAVDEDHMLTCAHVVLDAAANGPGSRIDVDFPLLKATCRAEVLEEGWQLDEGTTGDVALLRLERQPAGMRSAPIRSLRTLNRVGFSAYGFPAGYDDGVPTAGTLGSPVGHGWVKLEVASAMLIEPGYSGAAVWSDRHQAVVGMIVTRDAASRGRVAFAIPMALLAGSSAVVARALPTPLDLDPARSSHWGPRSRGVNSDRRDAGWHFTGRRAALTALVRWITTDTGPALRVITGSPGSGKSAVLARLVTTSDEHYRSRLPPLPVDDPTIPPVGAFGATFHASGRTVAEFVEHVADTCQLAAEDPAELLAAFEHESRRPILAVDAVDESALPHEFCRVLNDLAERGVRTLAGCRPHLVERLADSDPLRLDQPPYLETGDVERYVGRLLSSADGPDPRELARDIATAASGNFLVAQLLAGAGELRGGSVRPFPRDVPRAFENFLDALPDPAKTRELFLPLAHASGDGLPADLWLSAAAALSRPYQPGDLREVLTGPAGSLLTTTLGTPGGGRHRLFHQALVETLTARTDLDADHRRVWTVWTDQLPRSGDGRVAWVHAPPYLQQHGAEHASRAGALGALLADVGYLLVGDLTRLSVELARSSGPVGSELAAVLELTAHRAQPLDGPRRATLFALAAEHLGLGSLAETIAARADAACRPRWAHTLGSGHRILTGHRSTVEAVAIGRAGEREIIASGGLDSTVRLWDAVTGEPLGESLTGHRERVMAVAVGRAGDREIVVSGSQDATVRVWDARSGESIGAPLVAHTAPVSAVACGRAGDRDIFVTASWDATVRLWDAATHKPLGDPLPGYASPWDGVSHVWAGGVAIGRARGRDIVAYTVSPGALRACDAVDGRVIGHLPTEPRAAVTGVAMGRAGERDVIVTAGTDQVVRIWDAVTAEALAGPLAGHTDRIGAIAIGRAGDRDIVASASGDATVRVWDAITGHPVGDPLIHPWSVTTVAVGAAGRRGIVVSAGIEEVVRVWDAASGEGALGNPLRGHTAAVMAVAVGRCRNRDVVASASYDMTVRLWDPETGRLAREPLVGHAAPVTAVACGTAGDRGIVVSGCGGMVVGGSVMLRVWDAATGEPIGDLLTGYTGVTAVAVGRAGTREIIVATLDDRMLQVWDALTLEPVGPPVSGHSGHGPPVDGVAVGAAGERAIIATAGQDGTVRVRDAGDGSALGEPLELPGVSALAIGRAGSRDAIVTGAWNGSVRVWDADRHEPVGDPLIGHTRKVAAVAIAHVAERDLIATAGDDDTVRLWDAADGTPLEVIHTLGPVESVALGAGAQGKPSLYFTTGIAVGAVAVRTTSQCGAGLR